MIRTARRRWRKLLVMALCAVLSAGCTDASKARRLLAAAQRDFQSQKYDAAEIEYESVLRLSPLNPVAIRQLGLLYFEEGRPRASVYLEKAAQLEPRNSEVQLKLAETYGTRGMPKEGAGLLESVLRAEPANEHALVLLAQMSSTNDLPSLRERLKTQLREGARGAAACHVALGWVDLRTEKISDAEADFQKASALDPKLASAYQGAAVVCALRKDAKGVGQALKAAAQLSPLRSAARLKYVDFMMQTGAVEDGKKMLRDITRQAPDYMPAWIYLMKVSFAEHKYDECKTAVESILARDNFNFDAMMQSGAIALAQRDVTKALSTYQRVDELYKKQPQPQVKYQLALAYLLKNQKEMAMANLDDALALDRNYSPAVLLLAELNLRTGNLSESDRLLTQLIKNHPENAQAQLALAETYLAQRRPDKALEVYQKMTRLFPKNAEIPRRVGSVFQQQGDTARARAALERSLSLAPDYLPTLQEITELDASEHHYDEAHRRLDGITEKYPKAAQPLLLQGEIYWKEGRTNQAEAAFTKAIELNPQLPIAYLSLARLYLASHQEQQALDRLSALVSKGDIEFLLEIGEIYQEAGSYEQARAAYEKLLAARPNSATAMNNLAYLDSEFLHQVDPALQLAEKARELQPDDPNIADTLGWILFKKHEYAHALSVIRESAEKQPNNPEVQLHLGLAYYMMGEEEPARVCLQRALASHAEFPGKDSLRRRLEILDTDPNHATPAVIQDWQTRLRQDPQDPVLLNRLALFQEQHGDAQKAADSLQALISINTQDWHAMIRLSRLYADRLNEPRKALELAKSAHTLAPNDGGASAMLGELLFRSGDYPWAVSLLEQAANQSPNQPLLFHHLALACYAAGRAADADAAMRKALRQDDTPADLDRAKQFLALRAAAANDTQAQASAALARGILEKDPNDVPALMVSARLAQGRGAVDEARQICQKVLSIYPLFAPAMRQLAILYSRSPIAGDMDKAYEWGEKARASMPDDVELAKTLGVLAYERKDYSRSLLLLRQSDQKAGNDGEVLYYLGMDYYQLKQAKQCKQALQRALDLRVPDTLSSQARRILAELK